MAAIIPYPPGEPHERGMLDVGDGQQLSWEVSGNPAGKPAVVLHGGPGSGRNPGWRRYFDPAAYRIVLFDQRGTGRSTPDAGEPTTDLSVNTTPHLVGDLEQLRAHLGIDRWLVFGVSWGSTLGLAYAEAHPDRVSAIVLLSVVTTTAAEVHWVTRDMGRIFPEQWERFRDGVPPAARDGNLAVAYQRLLNDPDPAVRERAARDWCAWEDVHVSLAAGHRPSARYQDPLFRRRFARLVTHYWANAGFLRDGQLLRDATRLAGIPGVLVNGRLDVSGPPDIAWQLARVWPDAEPILLDDAGHGGGDDATTATLIRATDRFATTGVHFRQTLTPKSWAMPDRPEAYP